MTVLKKSLAVFLAVITALSVLAFSVFADSVSYYYVETYFMNTRGAYGVQADESARKYASAGSEVQINAKEYEGFTLDSSKSDSVVVVNEDGSTVAKVYYQRNLYELTYFYEDQIGPQTEKSYVYYGAEIPGFEANPSGKPVKMGYKFITWSTDSESIVEIPEVMPANSVAIYPIYEAKTFTYTFDANGGSFSDGEQTLEYEYAFGDTTVTPEEPSMEHYEFAGWDADIPPVVDVEGNKYFCAMYNELTYLVVFMDGDEELSYSDGYYFGDIIEEVDAPEDVEAWTLSDGTYVQFPYEIKGDTYFYAAKAPVEYTARFYADINDEEPYAVFSGCEGTEIEFPEDPVRKGYEFIGWSSDITVMPDEDIDFIAEWKESTIPLPEDYLGLKTELYTYDEEVGDWVVAETISRGETVKARFFIESGFGISDGQLLFFYNDDAFTSGYTGFGNLTLNDSPTSISGKYEVDGMVTYPAKNNRVLNNLVEHGYITNEFMDNHTPVIFTFRFIDYTCHYLSGDEWFAEIELTAKDDAVGEADFFVVPETIDRPADGNEDYYGYINFTIGIDGGSAIYYTDDLSRFEASVYVSSYPVSTGYGRLIVDAGEGTFDDGSSVMKFDYVAGSQIDVYPEPTLEGYWFDGYEPEIPDTIDDEILRVNAKWSPAEDTPFSVIVHYVDFEDGETIENEDVFEFELATGTIVEIVDVMPESPEFNTEYILVEDLAMNDYNVVDVTAENIISAVVAADGSTVLELFFKLASHEVEFYADGGSFPNGKDMVVKTAVHGTPALSIVPEDEPRKRGYVFAGWHGIDESEYVLDDSIYYALWTPEKVDFNVFFLASGDVPAGLELPSSYTVSEGDLVIVPDAYSAEGYTFEGWYYDGKRYESGDQIVMPSENITLICKWKRIPAETTTQAPTTTQPVVTETTTTKPSTTQHVVTEPTTIEPSSTQPVVTETTTIEPSSTQPVVTETTTTEPSTTQPVVTETTTTKPATTQPVVTETTTTKPESTTTKPTTTKPVVTEPTTKPAEPTTKPQIAVFEIRKPSVTTINYGDSIILHLDVIEGELPEDAKIVWSIDNGNFKLISTAEDGYDCMITPNAKGDSVVTVTVYDKDGNEIGSDTQTMTSKAGFFQKLIAFFKKLFGLTKVIPEAFRPVFEK